MEVVGALASSLQIVSQCTQVTITIIKWIEQVRTVDERIESFVHEVNTLRTTYEAMRCTLNDPALKEASKIADTDGGGHLWSQFRTTLYDCERTILAIVNVLRRIHANKSAFRPVIKQLRENLSSGELCRLREQVIMFHTTLQLPMQMLTLTTQLRQNEMTASLQMQISEQFSILRAGIERVERISHGLRNPQKKASLGGETIVGDPTHDKTYFENIDNYVGTAKKFLDSATVVASTKSLSAPSIRPYEEDISLVEGERRGSAFAPLSVPKFQSITQYVDDLPLAGPAMTPLVSETESVLDHAQSHVDESDDEDDEVDYQVLRHLLDQAHIELEQGNYAAGEDNLRSALPIAQRNNFASRTAVFPIDIELMLGECLVRQEKLDEAINILVPITEQAHARNITPQSSAASTFSHAAAGSKGQALSAHHLLGEAYLQQPDLIHAETHALQAFKGRKKLLGNGHPKTLESVELVIKMYTAKGQKPLADAHRQFLKPALAVQEARTAPLSPSSSNTSSPPPAEPLGIAIESPPTRARRQPFRSMFGRSERHEQPPTSMPISRSGSGPSPFLIAEEFNQLSTSPHDTSSLHRGSEAASLSRPQRRQSSISTDSQPNLQRHVTTSDIAALNMSFSMSHQRSGSALSKAPTLYAGMSHKEMQEKFDEVAAKCREAKHTKAADLGKTILRRYDPESAIFVHREAELERNIKKSGKLGLAGTGCGFAPLHFFCSLKFEAVQEIEILLQQGADVNAVAYKAGFGRMGGFTSLHLAIGRGHKQIVDILLRYGATWNPEILQNGQDYNVDRDQWNPLLLACYQGRTEMVKSLLEHGMQVKEDEFPQKSWHGNSLLHEAAFKCDLDMVKLLMRMSHQHGNISSGYSFIGRPGQIDGFGMTPLMHAIDLRDAKDQKLVIRKLNHRVACLKIMLDDERHLECHTEDTGSDEVVVDHPRRPSAGRSARDLQVRDKKDNDIYWYADESRGGDDTLRAYLHEQSRKSHLIDL